MRWVENAAELTNVARFMAGLAKAGEPVAIDFETSGEFVAGGVRPRLVQLYAGADEVIVADLDRTGFAPIACLASVGCIAYGAGFEARVFVTHGLEPDLNDAALAAGLRLDRDDFRSDLATTWSRIRELPVPRNKKAMQRSDWSGRPTPEQVAYAAADALMVYQVWMRCPNEVRSRALPCRQGGDPRRRRHGDGRPGLRRRRAQPDHRRVDPAGRA